MRYNAFLSYSHALDGRLAPALQRGLQRFAKRWHDARALRIFRDETGLSTNPHLWSSIEAALGSSGYFVLLASPAAAASQWVDRECAWWCANRPADRILIVLTEGSLDWQSEQRQSLPPSLRATLGSEPRFLDLRWARDAATDLSLQHNRFREAVADLAAPLHGRPKDELIGEEVVQHRRVRRLVRAGVTALAVLTLAAIGGAIWALQQQAEAQRHAAIAVHNAQEASIQRDAAEAAEQRAVASADLAKAKEAEALEQLAMAQINESQLLAARAELELETGDAEAALGLALASLPASMEAPDRPLVPESLSILAAALPRLSLTAVGRYYDGDNLLEPQFLAFESDNLLQMLTTAGQVWQYQAPYMGSTLQPESLKVFPLDGDLGLMLMLDGPRRLHVVPTHDSAERWTIDLPGELTDAAFIARDTVVTLLTDGRLIAWKSNGQTAALPGSTRPGRKLGWPCRAHHACLSYLDAEGDLYIWSPWRPNTEELFVSRSSLNGASVLEVSTSQTRALVEAMDGYIRLWNLEDLSRFFTLGHRKDIERVAFSRTGRYLIVIGASRTAKLYNSATGVELLALPRRDQAFNFSFDFSDRYIATWASDGRIEVWNVADRRLVAALTHGGPVSALAWRSNGDVLATASEDRTVRIWTLPRDSVVMGRKPGTLSAFDESVMPAGFRLLKIDGSWQLWTADGVKMAVPQDPSAAVVAFAPDSATLASGYENGRVVVERLPMGTLFSTDLAGAVTAIAVNAAGDLVATGDVTGTVGIWRVGQRAASWLQTPGPVKDLLLLHAGIRMAVLLESGELQLIRTHDGQAIGTSQTALAIAISAIDGGRRLLTTYAGALVSIIDAMTGETLMRVTATADVRHAAADPTGRYLALAQADNSVSLWRRADSRQVAHLPLTASPSLVTFDATGEFVAAGDFAGSLRIWRTADGAEVYRGTSQVAALAALPLPDRKEIVVDLMDGSNAVLPWRSSQDAFLLARALRYDLRSQLELMADWQARGLLDTAALSAEPVASCEQWAGDPVDPNHLGPGMAQDQLRSLSVSLLPVCQKAVQERPDDLRLRYQLARILLETEKQQEGKHHLAIATDGQYPIALRMTAMALLAEGSQRERGIAMLEQAYALGVAEAASDLALAYQATASTNSASLRAMLDWIDRGMAGGSGLAHVLFFVAAERGWVDATPAERLAHLILADRLTADQSNGLQEFRASVARSWDPAATIEAIRIADEVMPP